MATVPRLKYAGGKVAIYTVDSAAPNDDPLTSPLSNVSRLLFHSDLPMPAIVKVAGNYKTSGSTSLPAIGTATTYQSSTHTLFAHGQAGTPMVFGRITSLGDGTVAFAGSVPLTAPSSFGFGRWAHLGATATDVIMRVVSITSSVPAGGTTLPALTVNWEIFVTNFLLDASQPADTDPGVLLRMQSDRVTANAGQFDTQKRYLRIGSSGTTIPMVKGKTIDVRYTSSVAPNNPGTAWRYSVDGYVQEYTGGIAASTFNATFTETKLY